MLERGDKQRTFSSLSFGLGASASRTSRENCARRRLRQPIERLAGRGEDERLQRLARVRARARARARAG